MAWFQSMDQQFAADRENRASSRELAIIAMLALVVTGLSALAVYGQSEYYLRVIAAKLEADGKAPLDERERDLIRDHLRTGAPLASFRVERASNTLFTYPKEAKNG